MNDEMQMLNRKLSERGEQARVLDTELQNLKTNGGDVAALMTQIDALNQVRAVLRARIDQLAAEEKAAPIHDPAELNRHVSRLAAEIHEIEHTGLPRGVDGAAVRQKHAALHAERARLTAARDALLLGS